MNPISVRPFRLGDGAAFKALNLAWIERYFRLEPMDLEVLEHPELILDGGGVIFIAEQEGSPIGSVALLPHRDGVMKVEKMAVAETHRGQGAGSALMRAAIDHAKRAGLKQLYLESSPVLKVAVALYEKSGFRHLAPEEREPSPYQRAEVFMALTIC